MSTEKCSPVLGYLRHKIRLCKWMTMSCIASTCLRNARRFDCHCSASDGHLGPNRITHDQQCQIAASSGSPEGTTADNPSGAPRRLVQAPGRHRDVAAGRGLPKQVRATGFAETSPRLRRRTIPRQSAAAVHHERPWGTGRVANQGPPAHHAVAGRDVPQGLRGSRGGPSRTGSFQRPAAAHRQSPPKPLAPADDTISLEQSCRGRAGSHVDLGQHPWRGWWTRRALEERGVPTIT